MPMSAAGLARSAEKTAATMSRTSPRSSSSTLASSKQHDQEDAADDRHAEDDLQSGLGDELDDDERPVGGGDERAALERRLQCRRMRHRQDPVYLCGILLYEWLCPFRAAGRRSRVSWRRLLGAGLLAAALAGLAGGVHRTLVVRLDDAAAAARVEALVRREFDGMTAALTAVAPDRQRSGRRDRRSPRDPTTARALFDLLAGRPLRQSAPRRHRGHGLRRGAWRIAPGAGARPTFQAIATVAQISSSHALGARPPARARPCRSSEPGAPTSRLGADRRRARAVARRRRRRDRAGRGFAADIDRARLLAHRRRRRAPAPRRRVLLRTPAEGPLVEGYVAPPICRRRARAPGADRSSAG